MMHGRMVPESAHNTVVKSGYFLKNLKEAFSRFKAENLNMVSIKNNSGRQNSNNRFHAIPTILLIVCLSLPLIHCKGNNASPEPNPFTNPTINSISPTNILAGSDTFTLTVNGTNFNRGSSVRWSGSERSTTYVSSTRLTATIAAADISASGTKNISVRNTTTSGAISNTLLFHINNPAPIISSINPSSIPADSSGFTLIIYGANFAPGSSVQWGDSNIAADYISSTQIAAAITSTDVANTGLVAISVMNPSPGGGLSNSVTFEVKTSGVYILTKNLPDGYNAKEYAYTLQAEGGSLPYTWTIQAGSLPGGLNLDSNGDISGNPPVVGVDTDYVFTAQVSGGVLTDSQDLSIRIRTSNFGRNDTCGPNTATPISNGPIRASLSPYGDRDVYSFQGTAGNRVTIEVFAQRMPLYGDPREQDIYMDSFLEILDDVCSTIQYNDDIDLGIVLDSKIADYSLPYTGTYYIRISDLRGDGRPDFQYDLHLSGAD